MRQSQLLKTIRLQLLTTIVTATAVTMEIPVVTIGIIILPSVEAYSLFLKSLGQKVKEVTKK